MPTRICTEVLCSLLDRRDPPVLVEALGAGFHADAHLPGAINIPRGQVDCLAPVLLPDRAAKIVVYCTSSCASSDAVGRRLEELGYTSVAVYTGGKEGWVEHGLPLDRVDAGRPAPHASRITGTSKPATTRSTSARLTTSLWAHGQGGTNDRR